MYNSAHHHKPATAPSPESAAAADIFEQLCAASTFKSVLHHYRLLCDVLKIKPTNIRNFYPKLKSKLRSWKAQALWSKFDKRASHKCYNHGKSCPNNKVLIIGAGPCGLRTAIEAQLLGAKVVVVEKRDRFSRNNVLHLWPFVISDLKLLGAKKFYGKFCAGAIDHISIRQLQCILLKVALLLGVEVFENVSFEEVIEPPEDQSESIGWRARLSPPDHPANQYEFDVLIGADGKRNTLPGFKRKEFRGKLAIAITANFINKRTELEARVQEISGVAFIFNQKFFKELYAATGIDLENIVYYKDETHYFVMTAKKHSLIDKGVILRDLQDTQQLLHPNNVDRNALLDYAREAADFSTNYQLPHLDFAVNHYGKPDVAMFDFTSMFAAENACRMIEKKGYKLLSALVGDSLLEPFWPTGSGCARGFLSCFDSAWMIRSFASEKVSPLEVLAERESIYRLLAQTTPENLSKDHSSYTLEPVSRYPTINLRSVLPFQVRTLFDSDDPSHLEEITNPHLVSNEEIPKKRKRRDSFIHPDTLLIWCKKQVALYDSIRIDNMTTSFKDGRVLCAIIHRYRPDLIDFDSLRAEDVAQNNQLAFDILEREFGVPPVMTGNEMAVCDVPDKLSMISYVSQIYDVFRGEIPHYKYPKMDDGEMEVDKTGSAGPISTPHLNILKNLTNKTGSATQGSLSSKKRQTERVTPKRDDGLITCRVLDDAGLLVGERKGESLKKAKKRKSDKGGSPMESSGFGETVKPQVEISDDFNDKVKDLEARFVGTSQHTSDKKPKDLIRRIGKIEKSDWNIAAIEKKMHENAHGGADIHLEREKVPKWSKDIYEDKFHNIERRLRENGEDEETIAKYKDIDASLKRLEMKLREGSTLETGRRGQNKVSNLASQLSSKLEKKESENVLAPKVPSRPTVPLPTSGSDLCHFCGNRVYLVERLSAEGKFFHRQCFKCDYCAANLRLGNYIYDRDGRYGGTFFCIPHYGLVPRDKALRKRKDDTDSAKENIVPTTTSGTPSALLHVPGAASSEDGASPLSSHVVGKGGTPVTLSPEDRARGTTPERVEFENSMVEQSDEEEYLSEEEWTDRNFGASANELDDTDGDDDSDFSDLSDEEAEDDGMDYMEGRRTFTADETRRLAESWQRRYSTDQLDDDAVSGHDSESELDSDNYSEEYGAEGDDSHTATEGEGGDEDDEEEDGEEVKRAREIRRLEVNIDVAAPPRKAETSDSGSDTEVASDEESEESDTQIDTDSEFADDHVQPGPPKSIPTIVIDESQDMIQDECYTPVIEIKEQRASGEQGGEPKSDLVSQRIDLGTKDKAVDVENDDNWTKDGGEKSASLTNLAETGKTNPRAEQLKRLLQRTESTEAIAAKKALQLKRQYLLGEQTNLPRKSVSTADLGSRFKSFMDKISETQKMLNPAPQPSAAMQAFMNTSVTSPKTPTSSPSSPQLTSRSISLPQGDGSVCVKNDKEKETNSSGTTISAPSLGGKESGQDITTRVESSVYPVEAINSLKDKIIVTEHFKGFPLATEAIIDPEETLAKIPISESSSTESSSSSSSPSESDYDNVPSGRKHALKKDDTAIEISAKSNSGINKQSNDSDFTISAFDLKDEYHDNDLGTINNEIPPVDNVVQEREGYLSKGESNCECDMVESKCKSDKVKSIYENDKVNLIEKLELGENEYDEFGLSYEGGSDGVETINRELIKVNAPRTLINENLNISALLEKPYDAHQENSLEANNCNASNDNVDELFDKLASEAIDDVEKYAAVIENTASSTKTENTLSGDRNLDGKLGKSTKEGWDSSVELCQNELDVNDEFSPNISCDILHNDPSVQIIIERSHETEIIEPVSNKLVSNLVELENLENKRLSNKDSISSPEGKENTEPELSDWAGDNDGLSAGEDLEVELNERDRVGVKKGQLKSIARIASEESLGDTDSAISTGPSKTTSSVPSKPSVLADLEGIEYMDTSESASSPDESPKKEGYRKLEEETPTTPVAPQISQLEYEGVAATTTVTPIGFEGISGTPPPSHIGFEGLISGNNAKICKSSDSTSTEMDEDTSPSSVQEFMNNSIDAESEKKSEAKGEKVFNHEVKSMSEPPSLCEGKPKLNGERRRESLDDYISPKRYEGYIPRFKERMSPFGYVRDSLDVKRNSAKLPLNSPQQENEGREKSELKLDKLAFPANNLETKTLVSPNTAKKQIEKSLKSKDREKEKDLIREMVMSRISRKSPEKSTRRGSRTSNSPLSSTSSRTSLFTPQSSQENLLDKTELQLQNDKKDNVQNERKDEENRIPFHKKTIAADIGNLLRLDTVKNDMPESGQTFAAEENRSKIRVGDAFREDSVLGDSDISRSHMTRSFDSCLKSSLPSSGQTFAAEEGRVKVKVDSIIRDDSVLGAQGRSESQQETSLPYADDSQDEEVFERKDSKKIHLGISSKSYTGRRGSDKRSTSKSTSEIQSPSRVNLPATPMTHPEQFSNTGHSRELTNFSSDVPITPMRRNRPSASKGMTTPAAVERPLSTPNLSTVDRERIREEARSRARLKTDLDLGLSPPNLADNLREKLRKGSVSETEGEKDRHALTRKAECVQVRKEEMQRFKNKDERVKELLAEQREHRQREPAIQKEEWSSKDDRVRERLEEYRQKKRESSQSSDFGEARPNSQLLIRQMHRPSLLDIESLQVFTSSPAKSSSSPAVAASVPSRSSVSSATSSPPPTEKADSGKLSALSSSSSVSTTPATQATPEPSSVEKAPERKSGKKSKDRERRRSLIQVFAGMFSKSDEKKKSDQPLQQHSQDGVNASEVTKTAPPPAPSTNPPPPPPEAAPKTAPKSPSTVRDKLSRLRLSRSKDKKKQESPYCEIPLPSCIIKAIYIVFQLRQYIIVITCFHGGIRYTSHSNRSLCRNAALISIEFTAHFLEDKIATKDLSTSLLTVGESE
ncbi:[F-actin]-monooxygenase mical3 [Halocaridina rubra]|uniref:F-actin monooxygenase n=1 Tax=Halocaridina rubra TaxID=373956 RepID=A0AAN8WVX8_HALRR